MRRRDSRRWAALLVVLLALSALGGGVALLTGGHEANQESAAVADPVPSANPNRELPSKLPRQLPPGISMAGPNAVKVHLNSKPGAGLMFDLDTGRVLWRLHPMRVRPIASVTKMMTALLANDRLSFDDSALIKKEAVRYTGSMLGVLPRGRRVSVKTLMYGLLLPSANDAAVALADRMAGTDRDFAKLMNRRAQELGLGCTRYVSSYGLQSGNRSCAADLASLARVVMRRPRIANIVRRRRANVPFPYLKGKHLQLYSTNPLLRLGYRGTIGLKTGYTEPAGHCFVGIARRGGHTLGVVLLKSMDTGGQAIKLLNAGFRALGSSD